ncbi:D-alanyl-D-alanine carboxypeptidase [Haematobacter missouriensis]|uniref:D-alanyl-D-alanine carboxypeptidase/D-alanyl-D-alanine-endopeptidase n=1 Tax=Haematobacter missouriensis TaxID=366616 RepID=A0A212AUE7_9RHOB|nr:D-alanyl-D-alanine carboxypeptidase/D-alanyl-D-alanine-endopeptidase [Haematobacter missouriensis]KFI33382.1 D-alanyl-D-alanine carboxypeptidase [Haematobacter missouriensis]OWJ77208.1 D-alanyl-D-alanine carboxypeptidase/D-alanyl-D-alanine-endopeptidase [Haematobacter missouriensis]OWJ85065.1 D-alanyl-D-alanine carboxypeptidase/D-alanyl-D-alanine-endopeptidase [Haematobacter missouriensis]
MNRSPSLSRRSLLALLLAAPAGAACARAPDTAARPPSRPGPDDLDALLARARLGAEVSFLLVDPATGEVLDARDPNASLPPASVAKTITTLYAWETLGSAHRFTTRLLVTGPIRDGVVQGDLILAGGGDPMLSSDDLGDMAEALRQQGVRGVKGRFLTWAGALPYMEQIDPAQPAHVGYNPAVSGLDLNFNRVQFFWQRQGGGITTRMEATGDRFRPEVRMARMRLDDRDTPLFTFSGGKGTDDWTVAARALNAKGSRWLPVRSSAAYAGEAFRALAAQRGITLGPPTPLAGVAKGTALVTHSSDDLAAVAADMLKFSNNLTAETLGLTTTLARGGRAGSLASSASEMSAWAAARFGAAGIDLVDHSGLGGESRVTAAAMVRVLSGGGVLPTLLRRYDLPAGFGRGTQPVEVRAKTGTLNFASGLAGYILTPGRPLVFAMFMGDLDRRRALSRQERENPPGALEWTSRARRFQQELLARWIAVST